MDITVKIPAKVEDRCSGDLIGNVLFAALGRIEEWEGQARGWNQAPRLWSMRADRPDEVDFREIPRRLWHASAGSPADSLLAFARGILPEEDVPNMFPREVPPPGTPLGFALMAEAWGVKAEDRTPKDLRAKALGIRTFHENPARIETRTVIAADIIGRRYQVGRLRGGKQLTFFEEDGGEPQVRGIVPLALTLLAMSARLGRRVA